MIDDQHDTDGEEPVEPDKTKENVGLIRKQTARIAAVQCLYAKMVHPENTTDELIEWQYQLLQEESEEKGKPRKMNKTLFRSIFVGAMDMFGAINEHLSDILKEDWTGARMPRIMRSVLICAVYEMIYTPKLSYYIILREYTAISQMFMDEKDTGFMYATLHNCGAALRADEANSTKQSILNEGEQS